MDASKSNPAIDEALPLRAINKQAKKKQAFLLDGGQTGFFALVASALCSNVGIGSFVAIYLFASQSFLVGVSVAMAYMLGLGFCAMLAPLIHRSARRHNCYGWVDLIARSHSVKHLSLIWLPVAFVFVLRAAVQFSALAFLLGELLGLSLAVSLILSGTVIGGYMALGGYRAATKTDFFSGLIILALSGLALAGFLAQDFAFAGAEPTASGIGLFSLSLSDYFDLGPYKPYFLVGIWLFLPFSPLLAIDNWQRIATAKSETVAKTGFGVAALLCGAIYALIVAVGVSSGAGGADLGETISMFDHFRALMPVTMPWLADLLFITAIISSIDTFIMPLVTSLGRKSQSLAPLRWAAIGLTACAAFAALLFGSVLDTVIAAFNGLVVFLPPIMGAFLCERPRAIAAIASILGGTIGTLMVTIWMPQMAGLFGFALSVTLYITFQKMSFDTRRPLEGQGL